MANYFWSENKNLKKIIWNSKKVESNEKGLGEHKRQERRSCVVRLPLEKNEAKAVFEERMQEMK